MFTFLEQYLLRNCPCPTLKLHANNFTYIQPIHIFFLYLMLNTFSYMFIIIITFNSAYNEKKSCGDFPSL